MSSTGVLVPSNAAASWSLDGKLVIQAEDNFVTVQVFLYILRTNTSKINLIVFLKYKNYNLWLQSKLIVLQFSIISQISFASYNH